MFPFRTWPILLLLLFILTNCNLNITGDCNNHVSQQIVNKSKTFKIVKFDRGCGATTANSIQMSVVNHNDSLPNEAGNIFISNSKVGAYIERDTSVLASWLNDTTVLVKHDKDLEVFKKDSLVGRTRIIYEVKH
jgi:hypothetical protein